MQSSTIPDPGYQWESDKLTEDTTNESQEVSPFPAGDHKPHDFFFLFQSITFSTTETKINNNLFQNYINIFVIHPHKQCQKVSILIRRDVLLGII